MIHIERGSPPPGFEEKATELARRWGEARSRESKLTASTFRQRIRPELRAEAAELSKRFRRKCAFCEARMEHVQHPHIEHYRPKGRSEFEAYMFDWDNWLLSCGRCNESKWKHFPDCSGMPCLLDPAFDQPGQHLAFHRQDIEGLTERGRETVRLLGLDRPPLARERASWLVRVGSLLLLAACAKEKRVQSEARQLLIWCLQDDAPFAAMTRAWLSHEAPRLANPAQPHPRVSEADGLNRVARLVAEHRAETQQLI
ncbi:MAG: hypothetical protein HY735_09525 [Verrucomicrobia bacterium]|nr:hypothetical protein [Verrucomicrobiota bacterium]